MKHILTHHQFAAFWFGMASAILAFEPFLWLVRTWFDPSYSSGAVYLVAIASLLIVLAGVLTRFRKKLENINFTKSGYFWRQNQRLFKQKGIDRTLPYKLRRDSWWLD
ncbi:hypothetical protein SAMN04488518_10213 [Pseudovibrio ascidiaceicola]|uniref:Uncharacterized protein n=1 Tax=Pseudovibrio ascidiaceicola TaxID=285279 RepID=A0A1I3WK88_9HYPH|nr:hypothetical protein [Pseudovibrio ascidiaceicola]SFK07905.1 hypothetical protein SAMN04488518_10213 [Pseudovibrio ascidiaceicola]